MMGTVVQLIHLQPCGDWKPDIFPNVRIIEKLISKQFQPQLIFDSCIFHQ